MFTVLACGSRKWTDYGTVLRKLREIAERHHYAVRVIHGGAAGADSMAARAAQRIGLEVVRYPADWKRHGKSAGYKRNVQMVDEAPDLVLAFQVNGSRGTQHTIDIARRRGITTEVIT